VTLAAAAALPTPAVLLAAMAGICAGAAVAEWAAGASASRAGSPGGRRRGGAASPRGVVRRRRWIAARLARLLAGAGRRTGAPPAPRDLGARLEAAGTPRWLRPQDVMALKAGAALVALLACAPSAVVLPARLATVLLVAVLAGCFVAPDLWLRRRIAARGRAMERELADVLDLLRVAVEAGLAPTRALAEVGRRRGGLLGAELAGAAGRLELGVPGAEALERLRLGCPAEGIGPLVAALGRAARHGAPLGPALAAQAADARAREAQRVRDRAARAAPQIQLVIALLLVPAVMLLVAAALVAGLA
jgi:tight adherence protein C